MQVVADTSALVSLATVADRARSPLDYLLSDHVVAVPEQVLEELEETGAYEDPSGQAARSTLDRRESFEVHSVELDETFPLDDGENAAVTLSNDIEATQLLCDEFNQLALVHASLTTARLVTTPTLLVLLARSGQLSSEEAEDILTEICEARSWSGNAYVDRARTTLTRQ
jgi:predicted nucleic acid-binding protein